MVLMGKLGARSVYNLHKINLFYAKIMIPPHPNFSRQMVSKCAYYVSVFGKENFVF